MEGPKIDLFVPSAKYLAAEFGVSVETARRWRRRAKYPRAVILCLARDLEAFDPAFAGWTVCGGELMSPEGWIIGVSEVRTVPIMREQLAAYRAEVKHLREAGPQIEEQPLPEVWSQNEEIMEIRTSA